MTSPICVCARRAGEREQRHLLRILVIEAELLLSGLGRKRSHYDASEHLSVNGTRIPHAPKTRWGSPTEGFLGSRDSATDS